MLTLNRLNDIISEKGGLSVKNIILVMNPCAGLKKANRYLCDIINIFAKGGYITKVCMTQKKGDGGEFVKKYGSEADIIAAVGGDGTFNEVVDSALKNKTDKPIGYIPAGSTNDFGATAGLSKNILKAAEDIVSGKAKLFDVGLFNDRYFTYVASFGAFTRVSYSTPQNIKNALGHLAYILEGIKDIPTIHSEHMQIKTDNISFEGDYIFGAVSNSTSVGGILTLDPEKVDLNDGLFELLLVKAPKNAFELNQIIVALNGNVEDCDMITLISTKTVEIMCENHPDWTLDGEFEQGREKVSVVNIKDAIKVITGDKNDRK